MVVVAPTGIAAINAGGVTIHSFFQLPFAPYVPDTKFTSARTFHKFGKEKINIIRSLDLRRPIYQQVAAYGHFGRADLDLPWEKTDAVERILARA